MVGRARDFAAAAHAGHLRKYTGEAYIVHPVEVAEIVLAAGLSDDAVAAALLHDVVEDCPISIEEISAQFGHVVAELVWRLTDVPASAGYRKERKRMDRERIAAGGMESQSIKAADLISNTATIVDHDPSFARTYLTEKRATLEVLTKAHPAILERAWQTLRAAEAKIYGPLATLVDSTSPAPSPMTGHGQGTGPRDP
jgi:(p)ppGpp synthase/HD superfamily hydrolase